MGKVVMPKNSADDNEIKYAMKLYYDENDWLDNEPMKASLREAIGSGQYPSSYTKKVQMLTYLGLVECEDISNRQTRKRITEYGRKFYEAWEKVDASDKNANKNELCDILMQSIETVLLGRLNGACPDSKSSIEPIVVFIKGILEFGYMTMNDFAFMIWRMSDCNYHFIDALDELREYREDEEHPSINEESRKYSDAKLITMMQRSWGFFKIEGKDGGANRIVLSDYVVEKMMDRLKALSVYNLDKDSSHKINIDPDIFIPPLNNTGFLKNVTSPFAQKRKLNRIVFGAPGTGKSYAINRDKKVFLNACGGSYERITFYADYSYAQFIGAYRPVGDANDSSKIYYEFVPGPFIRVYVQAVKYGRRAYQESVKSGKPIKAQPCILLIEEINRAKAATVFGDTFQLLDRDKRGISAYDIQISEALKGYLAKELGGSAEDYKQIRIPDNMFIWATMNSADQGVFPIDTAFKRRWDFEYVDIDAGQECVNVKVKLGNVSDTLYDWNTLRKAINKKMLSKDYQINEDKLLGPFFLSADIIESDDNGEIVDAVGFNEAFKSKVIMYLYEDAVKSKKHLFFKDCSNQTYSSVCADYDKMGMAIFGKTFEDDFYNTAND